MRSYIKEAKDAFELELKDAGLELDKQLKFYYILLLLVLGEDTTDGDVHDAWALFTDPRNSEHPSLIPFEELSTETQLLDKPYTEVIHATAKKLGY